MSQPRTRARRGWTKPLAIILATAPAGLAALPGPASAQTLTEAFAYTYNTNPQLLAQRASLRATDESVPQALSNWRPTVTFNGSAGKTDAFFKPGAGVPETHNE